MAVPNDNLGTVRSLRPRLEQVHILRFSYLSMRFDAMLLSQCE